MGFGTPPAAVLKLFKEGTLTADGTEQTLVETTELMELLGWLDLSNMQGMDKVTVQLYVKLKVGGEYKLADGVEYVGVQSKPTLYFITFPNKYGLKVTLKQTAGIYRSFDYMFFKKG